MKFSKFFGKGFVGNITVGSNFTVNGVSFSSEDAGEQTSQRRAVDNFQEIVSSAAADIAISFGDELAVTIKGIGDAIEKTLVEVSRGVLTIFSKSGVVRGRVVVEIVMPGPLAKLTLQGAGDASITGMKQDTFTANLSGAGDLEVSGEVEAAVFRLTGAGDLDASALETKSVEIESRGAGDVRALATRRVVVDASGAGDISVKGGASNVTRKNCGAGDVEIR